MWASMRLNKTPKTEIEEQVLRKVNIQGKELKHSELMKEVERTPGDALRDMLPTEGTGTEKGGGIMLPKLRGNNAP